MVELISTLALVTKELRVKEGKGGEIVLANVLPHSVRCDIDKLRSLLGSKAEDKDINLPVRDALQRLDLLTQDELGNVTAQALDVVSGK